MPLTAKFATTCSVCRGRVMPGEGIAKTEAGWGHAACASGATSSETSGATSSETSSETSSQTSRAATGAAAGKPRTRPPDMAAPDGALEVWTDGACSGNPGPGGWAWATQDGRSDSGGEASTTNQRMEVTAALQAVTGLDGPLVVVSDSTYVVNCFRDGWWRGWLARGWVNSAKKPVANRDLWEPLIEAVNGRGDIGFRWVKGHSGDAMNDLVDRLAVEAGKAVAGRATR